MNVKLTKIIAITGLLLSFYSTSAQAIEIKEIFSITGDDVILNRQIAETNIWKQAFVYCGVTVPLKISDLVEHIIGDTYNMLSGNFDCLASQTSFEVQPFACNPCICGPGGGGLTEPDGNVLTKDQWIRKYCKGE